jgi:hypothetical protein
MSFQLTTTDENAMLSCPVHQHKVGLDWCCEPVTKYDLDVRKYHRLSLPLREARRVASVRRTSVGAAHRAVVKEGYANGNHDCLLLWD